MVDFLKLIQLFSYPFHYFHAKNKIVQSNRNWGTIFYVFLMCTVLEFVVGKGKRTRLTVCRVKPYFDLAHDAIMILQKGWIWTLPLDWTPLVYSVMPKVHGLGVEYLNLRHLIDTLRYFATPLLKVSVDLLDQVGLPHVLDLAVHLVNFFGWMSQASRGSFCDTFTILLSSDWD